MDLEGSYRWTQIFENKHRAVALVISKDPDKPALFSTEQPQTAQLVPKTSCCALAVMTEGCTLETATTA